MSADVSIKPLNWSFTLDNRFLPRDQIYRFSAEEHFLKYEVVRRRDDLTWYGRINGWNVGSFDETFDSFEVAKEACDYLHNRVVGSYLLVNVVDVDEPSTAPKAHTALLQNMRDMSAAFNAMRNDLNELFPIQSPEADLLEGPEFQNSCIAIVVAARKAFAPEAQASGAPVQPEQDAGLS